MAVLFNPTDAELQSQQVHLPLYYTGLTDTASIEIDGQSAVTVPLTRGYGVVIEITMPPRTVHTVVVRSVRP